METVMKFSLKTAKFAAIFALALGAPATFVATPAAAAGYHEMHRGFDHRGRGDFRGWHSERGQFRHDHHDRGFWFGR